MTLEYFISHKDPVVVVSFKGTFERGSGAVLQNCVQEIQPKKPRAVVLNMAGVNDIHPEVIRALFLFVKNLKIIEAEVSACELNSKIKEQVLKQGLLEVYQISSTLHEALTAAAKVVKKDG